MAGKIVAMAVTAGALLAGCATAEPSPPAAPTSTPAGPSKELVAWVDSVCQVRREATWNPPPPVEPAGSATPADRPAIVAYLAEGRDHFTQLKARADGIRKSPIAAGDEVTANLRAKLGDLAAKLSEYTQDATWFPDVSTPYLLARFDLSNWAIGSPSLQDLAERHPEVTQARKQAENC